MIPVMLPPQRLSSLRKVSNSTKSGHPPMTASSAPGCKQPGTPDAACAYPRKGCTDGGQCASAQRPARRSGRTVSQLSCRFMLHRLGQACNAAPRPEPKFRCRSYITMRRVGLRTAARADRFPDRPGVTTKAAFAAIHLPAMTRPPTSRLQRPLRPPPSTLSVGYADNLASCPARSPDVQ